MTTTTDKPSFSLRRFFLHRRFIEHVVSVGLRGASAIGKFALSLYMLAFLGLADLGIFGLLIATATAIPIVLGFGLGEWTTRHMIGLPQAQAFRLATTRLSFTLAVHCVVQPLFWVGNALLGDPIPSQYAVLVGVILLLEHLGTDTHGPLVARGHVILATVSLFVRSGLWPAAIIAIGLFYPPARSLEWILVSWVLALVVMMMILAGMALRGGRWRFAGLQPEWLRDSLRRCWPFYLSGLGNVGSLYADRFIISLLVGLELTGVYVFFWSAANVVHSISVYGTFATRVPELVTAAKDASAAVFQRRLLRCQTETMAWALTLCIVPWVAIAFFVQHFDRPLLSAHFSLLTWIIFAMLIRVAADSYHFVLYALHRDKTIAIVNLTGAFGSAVLNLLLVPHLGLVGAVTTSILVASSLLVSRLLLSRPFDGSVTKTASLAS